MNEKIKEELKACEDFINSHTPEELIAYEESLNLNYDYYSNIIFKKIVNGSLLSIGNDFLTQYKSDQHFNWFQKLMWKWCFGVKVEDYSEE